MDKKKQITDQISAYLKDAVRAVQVENVQTVDAIGSQETTNAVCYAMEAIFLHGLKGPSTNKNFWPLVKKFTHKATLTQITELSQINTDIGRCRAWIRLAFNDGALDSYCKLITDDTSTVRHYYESSAYLRDGEQCNAMQTFLQGLCNFVFNLAFNSTVLNQWTTTTLVLSGLTNSGSLNWPSVTVPNESNSSRRALDVSIRDLSLHSSIASGMHISSSCPQDLSFDGDPDLQLTQSDIDAIRSMSSAIREHSETPVSMLSKPDFKENNPAIYNQLVYAVTSDSEEELIDPERTDEQRDMRFEQIVRSNLDRYPLDYDRNQTSRTGVGKTDANNVAKVAKETSEVTEVVKSVHSEEVSKSKSTLLGATSENKTDVAIFNPFYDENTEDVEDSPYNAKPEVTKSYENKSEVVGHFMTNGESSEVADGDHEPGRKKQLTRKLGVRCKDPSKGMSRRQGEMGAHRVEESENGKDDVKATTTANEHSNAVVPKLDDSQSSDDAFNDIYRPVMNREESFQSVLRGHIPDVSRSKIPTLDDIIDTLPHVEESGSTIQEDQSNSFWSSTDTTDVNGNSFEERIEQQSEFLLQISVEKGLNQQCYQCRSCARAIGMFYDQDRVCAFDGYHYCNECHENKEHKIPAKIVYNWDFDPYKVSNLSYDYLCKNNEAPLLDIERLNFKLYGHVKALDDVLTLRTQLRFIKSYMMTCTHAVTLEFMEHFNTQPYLFDNIHLYSVKDLTEVPTGALQRRLQKIVKFSTSHVYSCSRCCQKGFYCEICKAPKVIYPFETSSTYRCQQCKSVYHKECKTHLVPCPKCKRVSDRETSLQKSHGDPLDTVDYSYHMENGTSDATAT